MTLSHSPSIVRDGLIFYVDAANTKSYPGSGTTWYDLSGKGYNAILVNSPTLSNNTLQFRSATGQSAYTSFDEGLLKATNETGAWTIEIFFKYISAPALDESFIAGRIGCHGGIYNFTDGSLKYDIKTDQCWTGYSNINATTMTAGSSYHAVMTYINGTSYGYLNGQYLSSASINLTTYNLSGYSNEFRIAGWTSGAVTYQSNIDIGFVRCYNRALTLVEVKKNFNSSKARFGI